MQFNKEILEAFASHASDPLFSTLGRNNVIEVAATAGPAPRTP